VVLAVVEVCAVAMLPTTVSQVCYILQVGDLLPGVAAAES